jgi:SAM-dependent methyltransferase
MARFRGTYLSGREHAFLKILDLGSQDINGSYRAVFNAPSWQYVGVDASEGPNVDMVLSDPYRWKGVKSSSVDVVVSGQVFEHIDYFWLTAMEIERVLKPEGLCCIVAPSSGPEHRYPVDCWRFYPDGLRSLARYAGLDVIEATTQWDSHGYDDGSDQWHDSTLVARKPSGSSPLLTAKQALRRWLVLGSESLLRSRAKT